MHKKILEYLKEQAGVSLDSEDAVLAWWQGLNDVVPSYDDLTESLEELEDQEFIEKLMLDKDFFIYKIIEKA